MTEANNNIDDNPVEESIKNFKRCLIDVNDEIVEGIVDSGSKYPIITYEVAEKFGFIKDKSLPNISDKVVSDIVKQVAGKKIWISLRQLLKIVKPEVQQEIINSITTPDIAKHRCTIARKKIIRSDSSSSSESGSEYSSIDENEIRT